MHFGTNPFVKFLVDVRDFGLEWTSRRYYSLYGGEVVENADDAQGQARTCVKVGILGVGITSENKEFDPSPIAKLALPASIYAGKDHGMYFPPEIGNPVWVSFDHGDAAHPRIHGSWWRNTDPNLKPEGSEVPAEFRLDKDGQVIKGPPTRRGTKTKFGHGIIYSDEASAPYVAIWSGNQESGGEGKPALVKQQITLSDTAAVPTAKDEKVDAGIYANTLEGLRLELDDTAKTVLLSGNPTMLHGDIANSFLIEDTPGTITIKTTGEENMRHEVILDNKLNKITIKANNATPQTIVFDGNTGNIEITSPLDTVVTTTGAFNVVATAASTHAYTAALTRTVAAFTDTIAGVWTATAATLNLTGTVVMNLTGLITTVTGQTILNLTAPLLNITSPIVTIAAPVVLAGTGANLPLVNTLGMAKYNAHTHLVVGPFPGLAVPTLMTMLPSTPGTPLDTTAALLGA